ncbi:MAG: hypothetical protein JXA90_01110 [Planctomycetes bacterium]|nr:hypothetical protein [Planctomycetota bacterium]
MVEHVRALGIVSLVRSLLELTFGIYLLILVAIWATPASPEDVLIERSASRGEAGGLETASVWMERMLDQLGLGPAWIWVETRFARLHPTGEPEPGDRLAFGILGGALLLFGGLRIAQSFGALLVRERARKLGLFLAIFDFLTPVTLPLAFWSLVVYRHPDTRDHFTRRGGHEAAPDAVDRAAAAAVE